ncbi:MAG: VIT1/CCC1 transporter family protein [Simkaniaceae bacterium]|nr:VIT1/CCC1 transporter family protein [Simkaniaceae bacterium]MCF7852799.1 VIT1/CCC1 transporter family protein [Simkaniaceae bacterium]
MNRACCSVKNKNPDHFEGKDAYEHLKDARLKTRKKLGESHGIEASNSLICALDSAKETSFFMSLLFLLSLFLGSFSYVYYFILVCGWMIWKGARAAYLSWERLEKLHRVIEEERNEIRTNRPQEKEELEAMYRLKGFEGELLEQVIDTLMADDSRLLTIMLEEELGLQLGSYEHPLKQAFGCVIGAMISIAILTLAYFFIPYGIPILSFVIVATAAYIQSKLDRNPPMHMVIWNMGCLFIALSATYFIGMFFQ